MKKILFNLFLIATITTSIISLTACNKKVEQKPTKKVTQSSELSMMAVTLGLEKDAFNEEKLTAEDIAILKEIVKEYKLKKEQDSTYSKNFAPIVNDGGVNNYVAKKINIYDKKVKELEQLKEEKKEILSPCFIDELNKIPFNISLDEWKVAFKYEYPLITPAEQTKIIEDYNTLSNFDRFLLYNKVFSKRYSAIYIIKGFYSHVLNEKWFEIFALYGDKEDKRDYEISSSIINRIKPYYDAVESRENKLKTVNNSIKQKQEKLKELQKDFDIQIYLGII